MFIVSAARVECCYVAKDLNPARHNASRITADGITLTARVAGSRRESTSVVPNEPPLP
ncbi:MAG: hypothetical protein AB7U20_22865 [Planctomycetaceae bacterium]